MYLYSLFSSESFITLITYWQFYLPVAIGNWLLSTGVFIFPLLTNCWTNHGTKLEDAGGPQWQWTFKVPSVRQMNRHLSDRDGGCRSGNAVLDFVMVFYLRPGCKYPFIIITMVTSWLSFDDFLFHLESVESAQSGLQVKNKTNFYKVELYSVKVRELVRDR